MIQLGFARDRKVRMLLMIDNYDSFVHNLARYFARLKVDAEVVRNDRISIQEVLALNPEAIVISPGPCGPRQAGVCLDLVREFSGSIPILGICLGHQVIGESFGGKIVKAIRPMHGRTSEVQHDCKGLFADLTEPVEACRYHSLVIERESLPDCLEVSAWVDDGTIMGVRHRNHQTYGLQFHPESILTNEGFDLLANFLKAAKLLPKALDTTLPDISSEFSS